MRSIDAYADLQRFGKTVATTDDVAQRLRISTPSASQLLRQMARAGLILQIRHGLWSLERKPDPFTLPEHLTAPFPAYVSLQSALYAHGMISQIPQVIYVASLARPQRITTSLGTFSIHRIPPELFGGFEERNGAKVAEPEKALVDLFYLANLRSRLFTKLPELELPRSFSKRKATTWVKRIKAPYKKTMVAARLRALLEGSASD